jgi:hypothetical protein
MARRSARKRRSACALYSCVGRSKREKAQPGSACSLDENDSEFENVGVYLKRLEPKSRKPFSGTWRMFPILWGVVFDLIGRSGGCFNRNRVKQPRRKEESPLGLQFWVANPRGVCHCVSTDRDEPDRSMSINFLSIATRW